MQLGATSCDAYCNGIPTNEFRRRRDSADDAEDDLLFHLLDCLLGTTLNRKEQTSNLAKVKNCKWPICGNFLKVVDFWMMSLTLAGGCPKASVVWWWRWSSSTSSLQIGRSYFRWPLCKGPAVKLLRDGCLIAKLMWGSGLKPRGGAGEENSLISMDFSAVFRVEKIQSEMGPSDHELDIQVDEETTEGGCNMGLAARKTM